MSNKLKLTNQLCFPFYAISRKITQIYTPLLNKIDLTYPQYLIMLLLWENNGVLIKEICQKLYLETNTISPILKTLEKKSLIIKQKKPGNNKETFIFLTKAGEDLKLKALEIPEKLISEINFDEKYLKDLHANLWQFLGKI